ncbi:hypothetical protein [Streptomyces sp. NPDC095817]|uniref:hypothetical protein n=1 Tax=Streptomyces sp. NPDC095817 TaxID=3155082 RepID=UPI00331A8960
MNGLLSDLLAAGAPMKIVLPLLLLMMLIVLIRTIATAVATVAKALHPGESADAVAMQANRIRHRRWPFRLAAGKAQGQADGMAARPAPPPCSPGRHQPLPGASRPP